MAFTAGAARMKPAVSSPATIEVTAPIPPLNLTCRTGAPYRPPSVLTAERAPRLRAQGANGIAQLGRDVLAHADNPLAPVEAPLATSPDGTVLGFDIQYAKACPSNLMQSD